MPNCKICQFSQNEGTLLATGSEDGIARIWTPSGDLHLVLSMHQRSIFTLKWNDRGTMILTGSLDHSICLWESGYGKMKNQWTSHTGEAVYPILRARDSKCLWIHRLHSGFGLDDR